jgi:hypothetical protein
VTDDVIPFGPEVDGSQEVMRLRQEEIDRKQRPAGYKLNATMLAIEKDARRAEAEKASYVDPFLEKECVYGCGKTVWYENKYVLFPVPLDSRRPDDQHACLTVHCLKRLMVDMKKMRDEKKGFFGQ